MRVMEQRYNIYFAGEIPALDRAPLRVDFPSELTDLHLQDRGPAGRGGAFEAAGDFRFRPLVAIDLSGCGRAWDGRYRVARAQHRWGAEGYRTRVEFMEQGSDIARWSGEEVLGG